MSFNCSFHDCAYTTPNYLRFLSHIWDKHASNAGFSHNCNISSCLRTYRNLQSFKNHAKSKHSWFYDEHIKCRNRDAVNTHGDSDNDEVLSNLLDDNDQDDVSTGDGDVENLFVDHKDVVASILLELREKYNVTTAATCFIR